MGHPLGRLVKRQKVFVPTFFYFFKIRLRELAEDENDYEDEGRRNDDGVTHQGLGFARDGSCYCVNEFGVAEWFVQTSIRRQG